jgi:hypothetical protein
VILPRAVYRRLARAANELRVTVEQFLRAAAERLVARPQQLELSAAIHSLPPVPSYGERSSTESETGTSVKE